MSVKSNKKKITWADAIDRYLTHLRAGRSADRTVSEATLKLAHLARHFGPLGPTQVHLPDLRAFQAGLFSGETTASGKPMGAGAVANVSSCVRKFFAFLAADGLIPEGPAARLEQPRCPRRAVGETLTVAEARRLLEAAAKRATSAAGARDLALIEVLYATGLRRAEALALDLCDVDRDAREVVVQRGKGGKGRRVPLTRSTFTVVTDYLDVARSDLVSAHADSGSALFLSRRGRRLDAMSCARILRALAKAAKLTKRLTPHAMRRSFATHLLQGKASLRAIQTLLGHQELSTTAHYLRVDAEELRREVILRHPREKFGS